MAFGYATDSVVYSMEIGLALRSGRFKLSSPAMWHINGHFEHATIDALPKAGFTVNSTGGVVRVEKYDCAAELRRTPDGRYQMTILPGILIGGQFARLWDAGYQKFWLTDDGRKLPALAAQLLNLRRFNEELRTALGLPTYYNEALGSTCEVTVYDRLRGRPGDVPDETVGAKPASGHEPLGLTHPYSRVHGESRKAR